MQLCKRLYGRVFSRFSVSLGCSSTVLGTKRLGLFSVFLQMKPFGPGQQSGKVSENKRLGSRSQLLFKVKFNQGFYFFLAGGQAV